MTESQKKAKNKYRAKGKRLTVDFHPTELELYEHIQKQPNKQGYIKDLVRADMKNKSKEKQEKMKAHLKDLTVLQAKIERKSADEIAAAFTEQLKKT